MADQRLYPWQTARTPGDQQNIAGVMGDGFRHGVQRRGQSKVPGQHRILHLAEVDVQRHGKQVERLSASRQGVFDGLLQIVHHIARGLAGQQIAKGGVQPVERIVDIAGFPGSEDRMSNRHKQLQRRLLAQHCLGVDAPRIAKQRGHQQRGISNAGFLQLRLQGRQYVTLDHIQQGVIARHLKAFAEQQLWRDFDVTARTVVELVVGDRHIGRPAADINRGHAQGATRRTAWLWFAIRAGHGREEVFGLAVVMGNGFVIEPDQLAAAGFVPLHLDLRHRNHALLLLLTAGEIVILRVPAHRFPDDGNRLEHAAAEDFTLLLRHGRGQGEDQGAQLTRRGREAQTQTGSHAVDLPQRLRQQFAQHMGHQGAAAVLRREDRQTLILWQGEQRLAIIIHQVHQREGGCQRFALGFAVHLAEAPVLHHRGFIPQVATRT